MKRWRAHLPRYRTPIIVMQDYFNASSGIGNNVAGPARVRVLKALDETNVDGVELPTESAPANHSAEPRTYATDWTAWWDDPPSDAGYRIPDPPKIARTALPTREAPILWEASAALGSAIWTARISAVYMLCEWQPKTGKDMMASMQELVTQEAALKVRPGMIGGAGVQPLKWKVVLVEDDSEWNLRTIVKSFRRNEFMELMVDRTER